MAEYVAPVHQLAIKEIFDGLSKRDKLYAHHLSRASWHGARIIMRQTSPESIEIFELIIALFVQYQKNPSDLQLDVSEWDQFVEYGALFLCNLGNYYGEGGQKIEPSISRTQMSKLAAQRFVPDKVDHDPMVSAGFVNSDLTTLQKTIRSMYATPPYSLGYPGNSTVSNYYPGHTSISRDEISRVARIMSEHFIEPENTRVEKVEHNGQSLFKVLQASTESGSDTLAEGIILVKGDHAVELQKICEALEQAKLYAANAKQVSFLEKYIESFHTGKLSSFRKSQVSWVGDKSPTVENMIGFVEPYRDPHGVRAEWEGVICISDLDETKKLKQLVDRSTSFIRLLPWAVPGDNDGKGPFEKSSFKPPDFTIVHALTFCASMVWEAANLPNYNDIREKYGFKNVVIANRMSANQNPASPCHYIDASEKDLFRRCTHVVRFITTAVHELLGHGTGKLLREIKTKKYNFDINHPPTSPLTGQPVETFYKVGQTWTSVFEDIGPSVEECRATLVSEFLMDSRELLSIFGYSEEGPITADDLIYVTYLQIGVEGLQALEHYNVKDQSWGEAHKRGHFAILKCLLIDGDGVILIQKSEDAKELTVHVDRSKILSHGKGALSRLLCRLHVWRCTADPEPCRTLYEDLTSVDGKYEEWRQIVCSKPEPRWKFVQANTFLDGDEVTVKVYPATNVGIIQSWVDRDI